MKRLETVPSTAVQPLECQVAKKPKKLPRFTMKDSEEGKLHLLV